MPYAEDRHGVYRIVNAVTSQCYVGSSLRVKKRVSEHFRLLQQGRHPNEKLQASFNQFGRDAFYFDVEVFCDDERDLRLIEECFLSGEAVFKEPVFFNVSTTAKAPMKGRRHTEETRHRISESRRRNNAHVSCPEYREKLRAGQNKRLFSDPSFVEKVRFVVDNDHLSYAERGRQLGIDTSSARKLALRYANLKGTL